MRTKPCPPCMCSECEREREELRRFVAQVRKDRKLAGQMLKADGVPYVVKVAAREAMKGGP